MKIAVAQLNYTVGAIEGNKTAIIESINRAKSQGAELVVFAEQAISGTPAYDLLNKVTFLELCEEALVEIASHCDDISVIVGLPIQDDNTNRTISVAAFIKNRRVIKFIGKRNVISRDEVRHLSALGGPELVRSGDKKILVAVGEDILGEKNWAEADLVVSLGADPYSRGIIAQRYQYYRSAAFTSGKHVVMCNNLGGQTDIVYDGSSCIFNDEGKPLAFLCNFTEDLVVIDTETSPVVEEPEQDKTENVYMAIKLGLGDFFRKNGYTKACLGLSGGIDSAVVLAVASEVLGPQNLRVLILPSQFSSDHSVEDAIRMAEGLGVEYDVVPITEIYKATVESMIPVLGGTGFDRTEEGIQARIRATLLTALCDKFGYVLLNTSNKCEEAVGYGILYGDRTGDISIIGDLYKNEVYSLARRLNRHKTVIPENIIIKEPSAELRPRDEQGGQLLPPYDILDAILYRMIEEGQHREEIINAGFDAQTVLGIYDMVRRTDPSRYQFCPVLRMSTCPFRTGKVMPLTNKYGEF